MTHPGTDAPPPVQPAPEVPAEQSGAKKWLPIAGSGAVAVALAAGAMTGWFGIGAPQVGDCVQELADAQMEVVDCGSADADYTIVGIEGEKLTEEEFMADPETCAEFDTVEIQAAFWEAPGMITEKGTVYCAGPV
jgi:hypothetical protein